MPIRPALAPLVWLLLLATHQAARAEPNPYYIGASLGATYDSNLLRTPSRAGDTYYSAGVLGGVDQPIGRQRVYASGTLRNNSYKTHTEYNNTSYSLSAGLDWSTVEKLSGTLTHTANSNLINYGGSYTGTSRARNIETTNQTLASVQYGMASLLSAQGTLTHRRVAYSDPIYQANGVTQDAVGAGIVYRPSGGLSFGGGPRFTRGKYASGNGNFNRRDLDVNATWVPTGLSTLNTRLSATRQTAEGTNGPRDYSGATGFLSWAYQPTGKLQFNTWISRDTGAESTFLNPNAPVNQAVGDTSQVSNTLAVDAAYAATGKIKVNAGARTSRRKLAFGVQAGNDTVSGASLGATYSVLRNAQLSCNLGYETRSTSNAALSEGYKSTAVGCYAQLTLQ